MTDIVQRLRQLAGPPNPVYGWCLLDAADLITKLRTENAELKAILLNSALDAIDRDVIRVIEADNSSSTRQEKP